MTEPAEGARLATLLAPFRAHPEQAVLLFDFDGTLSPIVDDPDHARALPETVALLDQLAERYQRVGAVSGRGVDFLAGNLPESMALSGLYGLEERIAGEVADHPEADRWRPIVAEAVVRVRAEGPADALVEPKGLSITIHYRTAPEVADAVEAVAAEVGRSLGLEVRSAKMSVELHPPIDADKGTAVRHLVGDARAVLFAGDDVGDVPAFRALAALGAEGRTVVRVGVGGADLAPELAALADVVIADAHAVPDLLRALLPV